jgi:hypothetical protein
MSSTNLDLNQDIDSATPTPLIPSGVGFINDYRREENTIIWLDYVEPSKLRIQVAHLT